MKKQDAKKVTAKKMGGAGKVRMVCFIHPHTQRSNVLYSQTPYEKCVMGRSSLCAYIRMQKCISETAEWVSNKFGAVAVDNSACQGQF
jgi:hypothetical protein